MLCRRCGILGDPVRLKWWHKLLPRTHRYYCAGCGRTFLSFSDQPPKGRSSVLPTTHSGL